MHPHLKAPDAESLTSAVGPMVRDFANTLPEVVSREYLDCTTKALLRSLLEQGFLVDLSYHYDFVANTLTVKGRSANYPVSNELSFTVDVGFKLEE